MRRLNLTIGDARLYAGPFWHKMHDCGLALYWGRRGDGAAIWHENEISISWDWPRVEFCSPIADDRGERETYGRRIPATRWTGRRRAIKRIRWAFGGAVRVPKVRPA
jgi:hypothetical protein